VTSSATCAHPADRTTERELYVAVAQNSAFNEYRCNGLSADKTKREIERRFAKRIQAVTAAMVAKYGEGSVELQELTLIGKKCPAYRGSILQLARNLTKIEKRLGLK
jgi:hypothetical protein